MFTQFSKAARMRSFILAVPIAFGQNPCSLMRLKTPQAYLDGNIPDFLLDEGGQLFYSGPQVGQSGNLFLSLKPDALIRLATLPR